MPFLSEIIQKKEPIIMGILNVTPDSFSDGGLFNNSELALQHAQKMVQQGAQIIDVGGESTRPGAHKVSIQEECDRVLPIIEKLKQTHNIYISIDTCKAQVMSEAIKLGVDMVNDVCALQEEGSLSALKNQKVDICLMHKKGTPKTMQKAPEYKNITHEVKTFLKQRIDACQSVGIKLSRLCIDPGFGFGKTLDHNYQLLNNLEHLQGFELPILVGTSRKSMIGDLCKVDIHHRLGGSIATALIAVQKGAKIIRTHDVFETKQALQIIMKTNET